jgi:hypothetical protein
MSEYQYYEFLAIDRPLSQADMTALRRITSRAEITATRLSNVYNFGDFRGDPRELMGKYFDAMVYITNWGTRQLMLKLPSGAVDPEEASVKSAPVRARAVQGGSRGRWPSSWRGQR